MPFQPSLGTLRDALLFGTALFGAFFAALWLALVFWTYRDLARRSQDRVLRLLAAVVVLLLGPLGVIIYLLLRPASTLEETYQHALEEEALLSEIEARSQCPGCGARTLPDWQVCPACATRLRRACATCGSLLELGWRLCPHCATPSAARADNGTASREPSAPPAA